MDATYLDFNASAPAPVFALERVRELYAGSFGNPSSLHASGRRSRRLINDATEEVAAYLGCQHHQVFWTSGASEANSWVVYSALERAHREHPERKPRLIVSAIEHESVLLAAQNAAEHGAQVEIIPVLPNGVIDLTVAKTLLAEPADLIAVMYANNETGVIQPVYEVSALALAAGTPYLCDAVQALGKAKLDLSKLGQCYTVFSGHKVGAPKGVGFVVVTAKGRLLDPMIHGKQQKALRGGTENPLSVSLTGHIIRSIKKGTYGFNRELLELRRRFEAELKQNIQGVVIHGEAADRLLNTTYVGFTQIDGDAVLMSLDLEGIQASSGSACSSGSTDPSGVLMSMGVCKELARSSVRFSAGPGTQWSDYQRVLDVLPDIVTRARAASIKCKAQGVAGTINNSSSQDIVHRSTLV